MPIATNDIRSGNKVEIEGKPYVILDNEHVKPGKGQAFNRIKMENIETGAVATHTYKSGEKFDEADIEEKPMTWMFSNGDTEVFADEDYEQFEVDAKLIERIKFYLKEDVSYQVTFFNNRIIKITPPFTMVMTIRETSGGVKGNTTGNALKAAVTETGAEINVPLFINEGQKIVIDTRTNEYVSRHND
jgi:elongation factor P